LKGLLKSEIKERLSLLLNGSNNPGLMLKSIYSRGRSLDRADGFRDKNCQDGNKRFFKKLKNMIFSD